VRPAEIPADLAIRIAACDSSGDLLALSQRQAARRTSARPARTNTPTSIQIPADLPPRQVQAPGDRSIAQPLSPDPPDPLLL